MSFLQPNDRNQEVFPQFQNGRVININEKPVEWYQPFDGNKPNDSFQNQALYGIQSHSVLSDAFFSKEVNIYSYFFFFMLITWLATIRWSHVRKDPFCGLYVDSFVNIICTEVIFIVNQSRLFKNLS